jgi:hypothetical protein
MSRCTCACTPGQAQAIGHSAAQGPSRRSVRGAALTIAGMLGWLCVPKCPLCLATYVAIGSGITISFAQSQALRQLLFVAATGMILAGAWRLGKWR